MNDEIREKEYLLPTANSSMALTEEQKLAIIDKGAKAYEAFLDALRIDWRNDPNSAGTPRRVAKSFVYDLISGCYNAPPKITSFPADGYDGIVSQTNIPLTSMCSHHHQPVTGTAYIGVIPNGKVIGLSKYIRIAQWCARRGQLQEDLVNQIAKEIMKSCDTENVAVYIQATHGCMEHRGVEAHSSLTQTSVVHGLFHNDSVKAEFFNNVKLQLSK